MPLKGLAGRRALVTGAASGIGEAVLERLKTEGVEARGTDIHPRPGLIGADLTDAREVEKLAGEVGGVDFLVNVAGGPVAPTCADTLPALPKSPRALEDVSEAEWARVIACNLTTAFLVCREFGP